MDDGNDPHHHENFQETIANTHWEVSNVPASLCLWKLHFYALSRRPVALQKLPEMHCKLGVDRKDCRVFKETRKWYKHIQTHTKKHTKFDKPHIHSSNLCHSRMPKLGARIQPARIGAQGSRQVCRSPVCFWMSPGHQSPSRESRKKWFLIIWYFLKMVIIRPDGTGLCHGRSCWHTRQNFVLQSPEYIWVSICVHILWWFHMISICVHAVHSIAQQLGSRPVQSKHRSWSVGRHSQSLQTWLRPCSSRKTWNGNSYEEYDERLCWNHSSTTVVTRYDCCGKAPTVFPFRWNQLTPAGHEVPRSSHSIVTENHLKRRGPGGQGSTPKLYTCDPLTRIGTRIDKLQLCIRLPFPRFIKQGIVIVHSPAQMGEVLGDLPGQFFQLSFAVSFQILLHSMSSSVDLIPEVFSHPHKGLRPNIQRFLTQGGCWHLHFHQGKDILWLFSRHQTPWDTIVKWNVTRHSWQGQGLSSLT